MVLADLILIVGVRLETKVHCDYFFRLHWQTVQSGHNLLKLVEWGRRFQEACFFKENIE